jgi:hypothetical protein
MTYYDPRPDTWDSVVVFSTGELPRPLQAGVTYYPVDAVKGNPSTALSPILKLSTTPGGSAINITSAGSGTITLNAFMTDLGALPMVSRGLDSGMPPWSLVNTANAVYDWTAMDNYVAYHFTQRGRQSILTLSSTPSWAARNQAVDAYGSPGGGQVPTSLSSIATYVTAVISRYNTGGNRPFMAVELWNEPSFAPTGTTNENWCGTMSELAQAGRLVNIAAKAADASILVLGPSFTNGLAQVPPSLTDISMYNWLLASDGAAGTGKQWIDGVCYHGYDTVPGNLNGLMDKINYYKAILVFAGMSSTFPLYQTERGVDLGAPSLYLLRCAAIEAAMGLKISVLYNFDSYGVNARMDPVLRVGMNTFYTNVCGKTITYCAINQNNSVTVTASGITTTF